jgi:hypothetical protein
MGQFIPATDGEHRDTPSQSCPCVFFALKEREERAEVAQRRYREGAEEESGGQEAGMKRAQKERKRGEREGRAGAIGGLFVSEVRGGRLGGYGI